MWGRALACLSVLPWPMASAAPWVQRENFYYTRASLSSEDLNGNAGWRSDLFIEYGLTDLWTVTAKVEAARFSEAPLADGDGLQLSLRRLLYRTDELSVTAELGALQGRAISGANGCDTPGIEARGGAAWSDRLLGRDTYVTGELVRREHEGCVRNRMEFALGRRLTRRVWTASQVWIERGSDSANSDKAQTELLWRNGDFDYAVGVRQEFGGAFDENSIYIAFARRF